MEEAVARARSVADRSPTDRRSRSGDEGRLYLRARSHRCCSGPVSYRARVDMSEIRVTIDGASIAVPAGATVLDACREAGKDQPTLCYLETLAPVNVCRVCVVEVEGSRTLVPSCSRKAEEGMAIQTDSERVRHSRKVVFELLASSVDLSLVDQVTKRLDDGVSSRSRSLRAPGWTRHRSRSIVTPVITTPPTVPPPSGSAQPTKVDNASTSAITRNASFATSASRPAATMPRTLMPSPLPVAASTPASPLSSMSG